LYCNSRRRTSSDFFFSDAILVQKICSDVSGEVSGKITSPEKNCYDASIVQKNCSDVSGEIRSVLLRTIFCYNEAKAMLFFASRKQFRDFSAKRFCFIYIIFLLQQTVFCCIGIFIEAKAGLKKSKETRGSTRGRRIARSDPSEDAQSLPFR
jgi:hypothetical protein